MFTFWLLPHQSKIHGEKTKVILFKHFLPKFTFVSVASVAFEAVSCYIFQAGLELLSF